jgi:hypothetical protein
MVTGSPTRSQWPTGSGGSIQRIAVSKLSVTTNFAQSLLAVLLGNAAYYILMPSLPPAARHRLFQVDLGLVVDFWFCVVAFGLIRTAQWWRHRRP